MQKNEKEKRKEAVISAIGNLKNKYGLGASEITAILAEEITKEKNEKIHEACEKNAELEGKCFVRRENPAWRESFPEMNVYYKVISSRSEYENCVQCLAFEEHPCYWFDYKAGNGPGAYYTGTFDFLSFCIEDIQIDKLKKEISEEEYNEAMYQYMFELIEMKWVPDHNRQTGILPSDAEWTEKKNRRI